MPRNVRNFWITVETTDGRTVSTGPQNKDGGADVTIQYRDKGQVCGEPVHLWCRCINGKVSIDAQRGGDRNGPRVTLAQTER